MIVRKAVPNDAGRIAQLYGQLVNNPAVEIEPEQIAVISNDERTRLYVCEYEGVVVGTALVSVCFDAMFRRQPFAVVENVIVDIDARKLGIGTVLFQKIENYCLKSDCSKIMLLSSAQRVESHQFFEKQGFLGSAKRGFVKYRSAFSSTD